MDAASQESPRQRRNRKVNTCDECRVLKRKCNRARPCSNCQKTGRYCVFSAARSAPGPGLAAADPAAAAPPSSSIAPRSPGPASGATSSRPSVSTSSSLPLPPDHTPPDICLRIGRLTIPDRIGGLPRASLVGELDAVLQSMAGFGFSEAEPSPPPPPPPPPPFDCFSSAPIASWFKSHTQAPFLRLVNNKPTWPETGGSLPPTTSTAATAATAAATATGTFALSPNQQRTLFDRYLVSVYPVCALVSPGDLGGGTAAAALPGERMNAGGGGDGGHGCSGGSSSSGGMNDGGAHHHHHHHQHQHHYDDDPVATALRAAVSYAAAVSMPPLESQRVFGLPKPSLVRWLQTAAEDAISAANCFAASLDLRSFQAVLTYLTPQLLGEVSRAHAVLVSAVTRQFQIAGLDRSPDGAAREGGQSPVDEPESRRLTRLHCWQHLLFLNIRATEAVGPERSLFEDPDAEMPLPDPLRAAQGRGDMVAIIRYECYRIHCFVMRERQNVLRGTLPLHSCLDMLDERARRVRSRYMDRLDDGVPVQKYARLVGGLLLARSRCMLLHSVNAKLLEWPRSPQTRKLRDSLVQHSLEVIETGVVLETDPELAEWSWYAGAYHQYHSLLFPLVQICMHPDDHALADRVMAVADHVFGPSSPSGFQQRAVAILRTVRQNLVSFLAVINAPPQPLYASPLPIRQHHPDAASTSSFPSQHQHQHQQPLPYMATPEEYLAEQHAPPPSIHAHAPGLGHSHSLASSSSPPMMAGAGGGGRPAFKDPFGHGFLGGVSSTPIEMDHHHHNHNSRNDPFDIISGGDNMAVGAGRGGKQAATAAATAAGSSFDDVSEPNEGYGWWPWPPQEWWP